MGLLDMFFGRKSEEEIDLDSFLAQLEAGEELMEEAKMYVKSIQLATEKDVDRVISELQKGNIILLNVSPMASRNVALVKSSVNRIKEWVIENGGDIARITEYHIIVTPPGVKILKRREA